MSQPNDPIFSSFQAEQNSKFTESFRESDLLEQGKWPLHAKSGSFILRLSSHGTILYISPALARLLALPISECIGKPCQELPFFKGIEWPQPAGSHRHGFGLPKIVYALAQQRVFEVQTIAREEELGMVLHDVTEHYRLKEYVHRYVPVEVAQFSPLSSHSLRFVHRVWATTCAVILPKMSLLVQKMQAEEANVRLNRLLDGLLSICEQYEVVVEWLEPQILAAIVSQRPGEQSPHGWRGVEVASEWAQIVRTWYKELELEEAEQRGVGLALGETLLGGVRLEERGRQDATILAKDLAQKAEVGQVCFSGTAWDRLLAHLPEKWQVVRTQSEQARASYLVGQEVERQADAAVYRVIEIESKPTESRYGKLFSILSTRYTPIASENVGLVEEVVGKPLQPFFSDYKLVEALWRGETAEVWKAIDRHGSVVALKVFAGDPTLTAAQSQRLKKTLQAWQQVRHRYLCRIYEVGEFQGKLFAAMEYVPGVPLAQIFSLVEVDEKYPKAAEVQKGVLSAIVEYLQQRKQDKSLEKWVDTTRDNQRQSRLLPSTQLLHLFIKVCEGLRAAHKRGLVHQQLTPHSILIRADGEPVIIGIGSERLQGAVGEGLLTAEMLQMMAYLSPEALEAGNSDVDERADVYSIGAILHHGLTGWRHFVSSKNLANDLAALKILTPPSLTQLNTLIPSEVDLIVRKALQPGRQDRYASMAALENDLSHFQLRKPTSLHLSMSQDNKPVKKSKKLIVAMACAILFLAITEIGVFIWSQGIIHRTVAEKEKFAEDIKALLAQQEARGKVYRRAAPSMVELARWRIAQGRYLEALQAAQTAQILDETDAQTHLLQAQIYIVQEDFQSALLALGQYAEAGGKDPYTQALRDACLDALCRKVSPLERFAKVFAQQGEQRLVEAVYLRRDALLERYARMIQTAVPDWRMDSSGKLGWPDVFAASIGLKSNHRALIQLDDGTLALNLYGTRARDLSTLQGLPISILGLARTSVSDLSPLEKMPMRFLNISATQVTDLSPLKQTPLQALICHDASGIEDLSPLEGSQLNYLALDGTKVKNLLPLRGMPLTFLSLVMTPVSDLSPLRECKNLIDLHFKLTGVNTLESLRGMPIKRLSFDGASIRDISALKGMPLVELEITNLVAQDLTPLAGMPLRRLSLDGAAVSDIEPLQNLPLEYVDLSRSQVSNLSALKSVGVRWMRLQGTPISDISTLAFLPLELLDISQTQVRDLSPLQRVPLKSLAIYGSEVSNLTPLAQMPLQEIFFEPQKIVTGMQVLRAIPTLSQVGVMTPQNQMLNLTATEFWSSYGRTPRPAAPAFTAIPSR